MRFFPNYGISFNLDLLWSRLAPERSRLVWIDWEKKEMIGRSDLPGMTKKICGKAKIWTQDLHSHSFRETTAQTFFLACDQSPHPSRQTTFQMATRGEQSVSTFCSYFAPPVQAGWEGTISGVIWASQGNFWARTCYWCRKKPSQFTSVEEPPLWFSWRITKDFL